VHEDALIPEKEELLQERGNVDVEVLACNSTRAWNE
jgi:hypothetical protein